MNSVDLSGATFQRCTFIRCQLDEAKVFGAHFIDCSFEDCSFTDTDVFSATLIGVSFGGPDLRKRALTTLDVNGLNLTFADLDGSTLSGCELSVATGVTPRVLRTAASCAGVDLSGLDISGWDLSGLDLSHASLLGVTGLRGDMLCKATSVKGINLHGLNLKGVSFKGLDLRNANLSGTGLKCTHLHEAYFVQGVNLTEVDLTGADLSGLDLSRAVLTDCCLSDATLDGTILRHATGIRSTMFVRESALTTEDGHHVEVVLSERIKSAKGIDLKGLDLRGFDLTRVDIRGADLRGCTLTDTKLRARVFDSLVLDEGSEGYQLVYLSVREYAYIGEQPQKPSSEQRSDWKGVWESILHVPPVLPRERTEVFITFCPGGFGGGKQNVCVKLVNVSFMCSTSSLSILVIRCGDSTQIRRRECISDVTVNTTKGKGEDISFYCKRSDWAEYPLVVVWQHAPTSSVSVKTTYKRDL
ncbi:hypothetical protein KIPB_002007 [Kipferlia bialata]|uniref:Pentapeptide repeat-containing protein n=1 Tax=Kipferlia bialata TaxID=797122 RepID=A0A391NJ44_9EUKA|nr:hypothetical protein KIPB_002007 [Kipferlia bialata]|eukprot:g2007.t1